MTEITKKKIFDKIFLSKFRRSHEILDHFDKSIKSYVKILEAAGLLDPLHPLSPGRLKGSLLNCVGCVVRWVTWVRGLRGSIFYVGCVGYVGQDIFYMGQYFTWVIIFMWVAWVRKFFAWVFAWVNF